MAEISVNNIKSGKIMVVEDDPIIRMILSNIIKRNRPGISVVECENGQVALEKMCPELNLIFTDNNMPELTGIEFIRKIKASEQYSHVPVVMVSVESREEYRSLGKEIGVAGWLVKPFVMSEIYEYLNRYL